ncbi:MAG: Smr/MutS family protein [Acetobacteraceae bacterium]|nr:Smr/MutS family protein [Acetobacteraceae bacterium]
MARRPRGLTEKERQDWALFARLIRPLAGKSLPVVAEAPVQAAPPPAVEPIHVHIKPSKPEPIRPVALHVGVHPGGLDNSSWNKFRSGKLPSMRTIDLHGRTVQRAYHALHQFLIDAHADHVRCVEVITGRGAGENGGAIRRELPIWLNLPSLRPLVLAATHPHPSNPGSVRLLLRRPR